MKGTSGWKSIAKGSSGNGRLVIDADDDHPWTLEKVVESSTENASLEPGT